MEAGRRPATWCPLGEDPGGTTGRRGAALEPEDKTAASYSGEEEAGWGEEEWGEGEETEGGAEVAGSGDSR